MVLNVTLNLLNLVNSNIGTKNEKSNEAKGKRHYVRYDIHRNYKFK